MFLDAIRFLISGPLNVFPLSEVIREGIPRLPINRSKLLTKASLDIFLEPNPNVRLCYLHMYTKICKLYAYPLMNYICLSRTSDPCNRRRSWKRLIRCLVGTRAMVVLLGFHKVDLLIFNN